MPIESSSGGCDVFNLEAFYLSLVFHSQGGHSIVKNTGGWLNSLGSGILVGKDILGFFKNIDLDNS